MYLSKISNDNVNKSAYDKKAQKQLTYKKQNYISFVIKNFKN